MSPRTKEIPAPALEVERSELRCGAKLLVTRREGAAITAAQLHLRGGHSLDEPGLEGVAYLTGNLAELGTADRTEEELAIALEPVGATLSGDSTGLSGMVASGVSVSLRCRPN